MKYIVITSRHRDGFALFDSKVTGWGNANRTSAELLQQSRTNLIAVMRSLYDKGYTEYLSTVCLPVHLFALNATSTSHVDLPAERRHWALYTAVSDWRPPALLSHLAKGDGKVPYKLISSASAFGYWGSGFFQYEPGGFYSDWQALRDQHFDNLIPESLRRCLRRGL